MECCCCCHRHYYLDHQRCLEFDKGCDTLLNGMVVVASKFHTRHDFWIPLASACAFLCTECCRIVAALLVGVGGVLGDVVVDGRDAIVEKKIGTVLKELTTTIMIPIVADPDRVHNARS